VSLKIRVKRFGFLGERGYLCANFLFMETPAAARSIPFPEVSASGMKAGTQAVKPAKTLTWPEFKRKYLAREDGYKYEWVNGEIEKTTRSMDQFQLITLLNLRNFFEALRFSKKAGGCFEPEIDAFFLKNIHRRPDISYYSKPQLVAIAKGEQQVPRFVVEIISSNDQINRIHKKMQNYRDAGVQVVWQIFPNLAEVHVYQGAHLNEMLVCKDDTLCSAAPVLPDFALSVADIFKMPEP
jgi:Uma2 family endonuclease